MLSQPISNENHLTFELITTQGIIDQSKVYSIVVTSDNGELGFLKGHIPIISSLVPGLTKVLDEEDKVLKYFFTGYGFCKLINDICSININECYGLDELSDELLEEKISYFTEKSDLCKDKIDDDFEERFVNRQLETYIKFQELYQSLTK